jgi:hypothetical protein
MGGAFLEVLVVLACPCPCCGLARRVEGVQLDVLGHRTVGPGLEEVVVDTVSLMDLLGLKARAS